MIAKAKLNRCAHCPSQTNLHPVFSTPGDRLYFVCPVHKLILDALVKEAAKIGVAL